MIYSTTSFALEGFKNIGLNMWVKEISKDIYVVSDLDFFHSNIMIARFSDNSVLIASSPYENKGTELLMKWTNKTLRPKKVIAINTHFHLDGTGGNEVFHQYGVETYSSHHTAKLQPENKIIFKETSKF